MRNILRFIIRYRVASILIIIQILGLSITYRNSLIHQTFFWERVLTSQAKWHHFTGSWKSYFYLKDINNALQKENTILREELNNGSQLPTNMVDSSQFRWTCGDILYSSVNLKNNSLILNKGENDGLTPGDGVLGPQGVMGIIDKTSPHYSRIIPIIHGESRISGIIKRTGHFGTIVWRGGNSNKAEIIDLPIEINLKSGDEVVTDPRSNIFPSGWPIGRIIYTIADSSNQTQSAIIELFIDYKKLQPAYIVSNNLKAEYLKIIQP
jgi:rod shape-determining protein MreC